MWFYEYIKNGKPRIFCNWLYFCLQSSHGRSDEQVAAEALANHMRCNNSFVYDLFQALYRSSLTCPNCRRHSNTFDPFLSVSLPIPQKTQRPVYVTVTYLDAQPKQVKIGLLLSQTDTVRELRQTLASDTKIPESQVSPLERIKILSIPSLFFGNLSVVGVGVDLNNSIKTVRFYH